jgi:hypothetical protein
VIFSENILFTFKKMLALFILNEKKTGIFSRQISHGAFSKVKRSV